MTAYAINEDVTDYELAAIQQHSPIKVMNWPAGGSALPGDSEAVILIVRESSTALEESRVLAAVNVGVRIVCVHLSEVRNLSELARKYCSAKVALESGALGDALNGNDQVQENHDGTPAPRNKQKPHNC